MVHPEIGQGGRGSRSCALARTRCRAAALSEVPLGMRRIGGHDPSGETGSQHIGAGDRDKGALQEDRKNSNIHANSGVIRGNLA